MKLEIYQTETIKNVLNECFGLQKLLKKYFEEKNENLLNESFKNLYKIQKERYAVEL